MSTLLTQMKLFLHPPPSLTIRQARAPRKLSLQLCRDTLVLCLLRSRRLCSTAVSPAPMKPRSKKLPTPQFDSLPVVRLLPKSGERGETGKGRNLSVLNKALCGAESNSSPLHSFITFVVSVSGSQIVAHSSVLKRDSVLL